MRPKRLAVIAFAAAIAVMAAGCKKKKAGASCTGSEALCLDPTTVLECVDGKFAQMTCKGPKGCSQKLQGVTRSGRNVTHNYAIGCDFTGNPAGDACIEDDSMCSADRKAMVSCKGGKIVSQSCLGPKACKEDANSIECDTTIQPIGEACEGEDFACTPDKKQMLKCDKNKFVVGENCRGAKGCTINDRKIGCDVGDQSVGEPCSSSGNYTCQADKKALLKCNGTTWALDEKCNKKSCVTRGNQVGCQ
jgi:hypothetical protein